MATLEQAGEVVTKQLRERVDKLTSAISEGAPDFLDVTRLADAVGEAADTVAGIYSDLEQTLRRGLGGDSDSNGEQQSESSQEQRREQPQKQKQEEARGRQQEQKQEQQSEQNGSSSDDVTKEELLERAREVNLHGR